MADLSNNRAFFNSGKFWTSNEETKMLSILSQTNMSSADCDIVFSNIFERSPRAIYLHRVSIAKKLLALGRPLEFICVLLHLTVEDISG